MKLTDFYSMAKLPNQQSKLRFDCVASTGGYEPFEERATRGRDKRFKFYLVKTPDTFNATSKRRPEMSITDTTNISGVYVPDLDNAHLAYGDVCGTNDALLFIFSEDGCAIEVFIARGMKNHQEGLYTLMADGELDVEMEQLRRQTTPTNVKLED